MVLDRFDDGASTYRHLIDLANKLGTQGISIYILSTNITVNTAHLNNNITAVLLPRSKHKILEIPTLVASIVAAVERYSLDILYGHIISKILFATVFAGFLTSKRTIVWHCGLDQDERTHLSRGPRMGDFRSISGLRNLLIQQVLFVQSIKRATLILTGTYDMRNTYSDLLRIPKEDIVVIPGYVDTELFRPKDSLKLRRQLGCSSQDFVYIYVGRLSEQKGISMLLHAFSEAKAINPEIKLLIIGGHPSDTELGRLRIKYYKTLSKRLDIIDEVHFTGSIPNREIPNYMSASDALVLPSKLEGFPRVIIEAMACGIPVIASNSRGNSEIVVDEHTGILLDMASKSELVKGLVRLSENAAISTMGEAARKRVLEQYSIPIVANKYKQLFEYFDKSYRTTAEVEQPPTQGMDIIDSSGRGS